MRPLLLWLALAAPVLAQHATANDDLIADALSGLGVDPDGPAWDAVPEAYAEVYSQASYDAYRLRPLQARAVAYVAVLLAAGSEPEARPGRQRRESGRRGQSEPAAARARRLAAAALALVPVNDFGFGSLDQDARSPVVAALAEAAGEAGGAACTRLGTALGNVANSVRSSGYVLPQTMSSARSALAACQD